MTRLAIATGSAALSVALFDGTAVLAECHEIVGRGHAERLVPVIAALLADYAVPAAIVVDTGPGSYTGLRVGIAAARALGLAWGVEVTGTTSTALLAADAFALSPGLAVVTAVLDAGRGQVFVETIAANWGAADWRASGELHALSPRAAAEGLPAGATLIGSGAVLLQPFGAFAIVSGDHPRAAATRWLPSARRRDSPVPRYMGPSEQIEPGAPTSRAGTMAA